MNNANELEKTIDDYIATIPNFPKEGIMFRDITTLLQDSKGLHRMADELYEQYKPMKNTIDYVAGTEARGFITGAILAYKLDAGFIPIRKKGKLPGEVIGVDYNLEYGIDTIEMQVGAVNPGSNVLLTDDLLATGGTMLASAYLVEKQGGNVKGCAFIVDLPDLGGNQRLANKGYEVFSLVQYQRE